MIDLSWVPSLIFKAVRDFGKSLVASRRHGILPETKNKVAHMIDNLSLSIAVYFFIHGVC